MSKLKDGLKLLLEEMIENKDAKDNNIAEKVAEIEGCEEKGRLKGLEDAMENSGNGDFVGKVNINENVANEEAQKKAKAKDSGEKQIGE